MCGAVPAMGLQSEVVLPSWERPRPYRVPAVTKYQKRTIGHSGRHHHNAQVKLGRTPVLSSEERPRLLDRRKSGSDVHPPLTMNC
jgi:hypothetical protein